MRSRVSSKIWLACLDLVLARQDPKLGVDVEEELGVAAEVPLDPATELGSRLGIGQLPTQLLQEGLDSGFGRSVSGRLD